MRRILGSHPCSYEEFGSPGFVGCRFADKRLRDSLGEIFCIPLGFHRMIYQCRDFPLKAKRNHRIALNKHFAALFPSVVE